MGRVNAKVCRCSPRLTRMTGDLTRIYGVANLEVLSVKRQRTLPTACRVYDLLNFASELGTHHATPIGNRLVQAYIGDLISSEYDLEGTVDQFGDWRNLFIGNDATCTTLADMIGRRIIEVKIRARRKQMHSRTQIKKCSGSLFGKIRAL